MCKRALSATVIAAAITASIAPAALAGVPAVDEYTLRPPDAGGKHLGPDAPNPRVDELPALVREQLESRPDGAALAQIATARELGAPEVLPGAGGPAEAGPGESGAGGAALSALTEPAALGILAALATMIAVGVMRSRGLLGGA